MRLTLVLFAVLGFCLVFGEDDLPELQVKTVKAVKDCKRNAKPGDKLQVHYIGRLDDENGKIFDASRDRGSTFNFQLGAGQVIKGYEQGVPGMCKGERRVLIVPPHLGYGDRGAGGVIPGGATLHFTIDLMKIEDGPPLKEL